jgi:hypothetical protein
MLKCGLGVWMGRWVAQGREVGRCKKLGHLEGRKKGLLGSKFWVPRADELGWIHPSECSSMDGAAMGAESLRPILCSYRN